MSKSKLGLMVALVVFLLAVVGLLLQTAPLPQASTPKRQNRFSFFALPKSIEAQLPRNWLIRLTGTPGTPVVVGYRVDGWRSGTFRGVIPTNFTVLACGQVDLSIKNTGNSKARIGFTVSSFSREPQTCDPFWGFRARAYEKHGLAYLEAGSLPGDSITPLDWPMALPPGMSKREAKKHDFFRERAEAELKDDLAGLEKNPQDHILQAAVAQLYFRLKNNVAAERAFEKFFHSDCKDPGFLNTQLWTYIETYGGTNLQLAYEVGQKALELAPQDAYLADTVGWILFKQGEYQKALPLVELGLSCGQLTDCVRYHLGLTHYMLMEEDDARKSFQRMNMQCMTPHDIQEAKKCLEMLDFNPRKATRQAITSLKKRLAEKPDDPVALDRVGQLYEAAGCPQKQLRRDLLTMKGVTIRAYRLSANAALCCYPRMHPRAPQTNEANRAEFRMVYPMRAAVDPNPPGFKPR